jgi:CheY-like chemotaxis protein
MLVCSGSGGAVPKVSCAHDPPLVLVVDDDPLVRNILARGLERGGYRVLEVDNAAAALRIARDGSSHVDVLVTDLVMPDMHGADLALAFCEASPDTRVVYVSGLAPPHCRQPAAPGPCLQKPFRVKTLNDLVCTVLQPDYS